VAFAQNLETRLNQRESGAGTPPAPPAAELDAGSLVLSVLWQRVRNFFRALLRR